MCADEKRCRNDDKGCGSGHFVVNRFCFGQNSQMMFSVFRWIGDADERVVRLPAGVRLYMPFAEYLDPAEVFKVTKSKPYTLLVM